MASSYTRLGDLLTSVGAITDEQLKVALELQKNTKKRLGTVLIENNIISEYQLIEALQMQLGVEFVDLSTTPLPPEMAQVLSKNIAKKHSVVPVRVVHNELYLAMSDPLNFMVVEEVRAATQKRVVPMIATSSAIDRAIASLYGNEGATKAIEDMRKERTSDDSSAAAAAAANQSVEDDSNAAPTIRLVNSIIERAVVENASDIHIEPRNGDMMVRMRIDGVLHNILNIPQNVQSAVISRIKIMGNMDIAEHRIPQDGRANIRLRMKDIDLRISALPTIYGEKITIRLLNKSAGLLTMEGIGLEGENLVKFRSLIHNNTNGVILIVGPTGSGKSSSMYTMIRELNREDVNLVTLEDPVEYKIDGINQVQINEKTGMTFANGLRSILRQDPDIISIGEIRDGETAEIAMRAAITGHLVLSTLHTNSAIATIDRLFDLGVEPYLVAGSLKGIISQRLVRRICPNCKTAYTPEVSEIRRLGLPTTRDYLFAKGAGCAECFHTGFKDRVAVFEILVMTGAIETAIHEQRPRSDLMKAIEESGFESMLVNCAKLVLAGITTPEEAYKAVQTTAN